MAIKQSLAKKPKRFKATKKNKSTFPWFKRVSQALGFISLLVVGGYSISWCLEPANFPIAGVRLVGERQYVAENDLRAIISPEIKSGFLRLKVSTLQQQLLSLPWVKQADVRKVWPDQLVIRFEEHIPQALWGENGIISGQGILFFPEFSNIEALNLPILRGPEGKVSAVWQQFLVMEQILASLNLHITHFTLAPRGAWQMRLSNGMAVVLGTNDILPRFHRFIHAYEKHLYPRQQELAYVDLRYTSGMAIGWKTS